MDPEAFFIIGCVGSILIHRLLYPPVSFTDSKVIKPNSIPPDSQHSLKVSEVHAGSDSEISKSNSNNINTQIRRRGHDVLSSEAIAQLATTDNAHLNERLLSGYYTSFPN
jgi:hypothetical protein